MISYNPENLYTQEDGKRIYNLYLRAIARIEVGEGEELPKGQQLNLVNAFRQATNPQEQDFLSTR